MHHCFAAVDMGATSGRVLLGRFGPDGHLTLEELARSRHASLPRRGALHWDFPTLTRCMVQGLASADHHCRANGAQLEGIGVDTWGVDYGLLDAAGNLAAPPRHYRDTRTVGIPERVHERISAAALYERSGIQEQDFNTLFQLVAEETPWEQVTHLLLMPDLLTHVLTGTHQTELTNASTTGLLDVRERSWSGETLELLQTTWGVPASNVLSPLVAPGTVLGPVDHDELRTAASVVAVGSHDTASAVAAVPSDGEDFAYISSGTWSLVGLELPHPVLSETSRDANFTNELGVDGTVRYLKNVMGLWVLNECLRSWREEGRGDGSVGLQPLLAAASSIPALSCGVVDVNDPALLRPGDMPGRLTALLTATGQPPLHSPVELVRCVLDSLALAYRSTLRQACELTGRTVNTVHIVGGGSQNELLCILTASATGLPVVAGPVEATAIGNLLVQARALGAVHGTLHDLRAIVKASFTLKTYRPEDLDLTETDWDEAAEKLHVAHV